jgi:glycosyltransferase involved in cell wall biosynthesis
VKPSVDVAIVAYNHRPFIGQAIESVLAQQSVFPVRVIVGDDGSTDGTQEIIRQLACEFPERVFPILHKENLGLLHPDRIAFKVLRSCMAKYVAVLDGDDYWIDRDKLQLQVDMLEADPSLSMCHHAIEINYEDQRGGPIRSPVGCRSRSTIEDLLQGVNFIHTCSMVYRRDLFPEQPAWFAKLPLGDWPMCCLLAQHGDIGFLNRVMAVYRVHRSSSWYHKPDAYRHDAVVRMYRELRSHLDPKHSPKITETLARMTAELAWMHKASGDEELANSCARESLERLLELESPRRLVVKAILDTLAAALAGEKHLPGTGFTRFARCVGKRFPWARPVWHWFRGKTMRVR